MIGQKGVPARAGGIERHVEELSAELVKQGHQVLVFSRSWYVEKIEDHRGVKCVAAPSIFSKHLDAITHTLTSIIKAWRLGVDVYHFHGVGPAILCWLPKLLSPGAYVIVTFHCIDRHHQKWNWFARLMLHIGEWCACHFPNETIAVSKTLQTYCHLSYSREAVYIPNGTHIPIHASDQNLLKQFELQPNKYFMMCARLVRHKGAHTLIKAWKKLQKTHPKLVKDMKLAIVGGSAFTDDYEQELRDMIKRDDSIVMTGVQTDEALHALFANAYAVVHPSESEGLPIAILEAMGYGKCVLSSDIPESLEIVAEHGMTFETNNEKDLAEKMTMLIEQPELVAAVGKEARGFVAKNYDWADIAQTTGYLYEFLDYDPKLKEAILE